MLASVPPPWWGADGSLARTDTVQASLHVPSLGWLAQSHPHVGLAAQVWGWSDLCCIQAPAFHHGKSQGQCSHQPQGHAPHLLNRAQKLGLGKQRFSSEQLHLVRFPDGLQMKIYLLKGKELSWSLSRVQLFGTPWTVAPQAPRSMRFSGHEYWSGLPLPSPGDLPDPGIELRSPALDRRFTI